MVLSTVTVAFGEAADYGQELKALGIIKGDQNGDLHAADKVTREEALITLTRMMGQEAQALECKDANPFSDVPADNWSRPYIGYAKKQGWTKGIGEDKFGLDQDVTAQEYVTFMLRALGYNDPNTYANAMKLASDYKVCEQGQYQPTAVLIRQDVFGLMFNTLNAKVKDSDQLLGNQLGLFKNDAVSETVYPLEIANYDGETLFVPAKPQHIVSLKLGLDELLLGLAGTERVAGLSGQQGNSKSVSLAAKYGADFP